MSLLRKQWHKIPVSNALKSDAIIMIISLWSWQHITCSWCLYVVVVIGVSVSICLSLSFVPVASWTHLIVSAMWSIYYGLNDVNCCTFCFSFSYFIINSIINVSQSIKKAPCACSSHKSNENQNALQCMNHWVWTKILRFAFVSMKEN